MVGVRVLGEVIIELDGAAVGSPVGRGARALLGMLALDRRLHHRASLAAQLWPGVLDESARGSLRGALADLRRALGPQAEGYVVATRERVGLTDEVWTDVAEFERCCDDGRLSDAMALYGGDLLAGLDDDWVLTARDAWRARASEVLERLAAEAEEAGDPARAIAHTRRIVALDPLSEEGQRALIGRLAAAGDRAAALAAYTRYVERLRTELRIAPSAATRALADELREPDPPASAAPSAATAGQPTSGTVTLLFTDLVGSTELLVDLGDDEAERLRRLHFGLLRDVAASHAGHEVKSLGDGLMVAFGSSVDAVGCAIGIQQAVERHNRQTDSHRLRVRVGLNVGEPIRDEGDYFGTPVVVAKRLCDRADGGQILAAELVRQLIGPRGGFTFRGVGELALKGLATPVPTCEVGWAPTGEQGIALPVELTVDQSVLLGRAEELARLDGAWQRVLDGRPTVFAVAGEPGIGKTRLVTEFCRRAQADGATVLLGRSHESAPAPYLPFVEALRRYVVACPIDELRLQMGPRRGILSWLVPELGADGEDARFRPGGTPDGGSAERHALFDAVTSLLEQVARSHPTVLVLDDLHWADEATLLLVRHLARAMPDAPLMVLTTHRATEVHEGDAVSAAFAELRRTRALEQLELAGLGSGDVATLIEGLGVTLSDDAARAVAQRTEGNPFFVEELARHVGSGGGLAVPQSVTDLLRRRLRRLTEPAGRALAAAAVLGREFDLGLLERVVAEDGETLLDSIDEALDAQVLTPVPDRVGRFAFGHSLIREAVYEQLSPARRPELHRRAAQALEELHPGRLDELADRLAHHCLRAGDDTRALDHQLRAGSEAARRYAPETAVAHFDGALATAARLALSADADERLREALVRRGWMRQWMGDHQAGVADYGRALDAARAAGDRPMQAQALNRLGNAEKSFDAVRAEAHHQQALTIAGDLGDTALQVEVLSRMSLARATNLDLAGALEAGERALELAQTTRSDQHRAMAVDALKLTALHLGDLDRLDALTRELEAVNRRREDLFHLQWTLLESAFVPLAGARWKAAEARLHEASAVHRRVGDVFCSPLLHDAACWLARSRGDLGSALAEGRRAVELTEGRGYWGAWTRATLGWALLDLRATTEAIDVLERGLAEAATHSDHLFAAGHLAWALALAGDLAGLEAAASEAGRALERVTTPSGAAHVYAFGAVCALGRAQLAAGRPDRGVALLEGLADVTSRSGWHEAAATSALVLALCHRACGDEGPTTELLERAVDVATRHELPAVGWEARTALAQTAPAEQAARLRAESAGLVRQMAGTVAEDHLAEAFVRATHG